MKFASRYLTLFFNNILYFYKILIIKQNKGKYLNKLHKTLGQVFTPEYTVSFILKEIDYKNVFDKKIIDPACGDGIFLKKIIEKIVLEGKNKQVSVKKIIDTIENNIYGIEIDKNTYLKCLDNLEIFVKDKLNSVFNYKLNKKLNFKIFNKDTLLIYKKFIDQFDYVVGNPPYIKIQNLDLNKRQCIKNSFTFSKGNFDIYLIFFEIGIKLLKKEGKLGYITPNSYLKNSSYKNFRKFLKNKKLIKKLFNLGSYKVFQGYSTYTAVTVIQNNNNLNYFDYYEYKNNNFEFSEKNFIFIDKIKYEELNNEWKLMSKKDRIFINTLLSKTPEISEHFNVQYGIATLRDKIFVGTIKNGADKLVLFKNKYLIEKEILKPILKISKYNKNIELNKQLEYIIFPYKILDGKIIVMEEKELSEKYPHVYKYLIENKIELLKRDLKENTKWYEYGRNQGLKNILKEKIALSPIIHNNIKFKRLPSNILIYSGIFITQKTKKYSLEHVLDIINDKKFFNYLFLMGKNMANNYKNINSKIIKDYPL